MGHHPLSERFDELLALVTKASTAARCPVRRKLAPATAREVTFRPHPSARGHVRHQRDTEARRTSGYLERLTCHRGKGPKRLLGGPLARRSVTDVTTGVGLVALVPAARAKRSASRRSGSADHSRTASHAIHQSFRAQPMARKDLLVALKVDRVGQLTQDLADEVI